MGKQIKIRIHDYTKKYLDQLVKEANEQKTNKWNSQISYSEVIEYCIHNYYSRYMCMSGEEEYMMLELPHKSMYKEVVEALIKEMEKLELRISEKVCKKSLKKLEELQCIQENKKTLLMMLHYINREIDGEKRKREEVQWGYFNGKRKLMIDLRSETCKQIEKICIKEHKDGEEKFTLKDCIERAIDFEYLRTEIQGDRSDIYIPLKDMPIEDLERMGEILGEWLGVQEKRKDERREESMIADAYLKVKGYIGFLKATVANGY